MFKGIDYLENEELKKHTSFKIGGICKYFITPKNIPELKKVLSICKKNEIKYFIIGNGSNLLVSDKGFDGAVISLRNFDSIKTHHYSGQVYVTVGAGVSLFKLNNNLLKLGISGLEWSYGIPGTIGGAVKMNAGAYDGSICDSICEIKYLKNEKVHSIRKFNYSYRNGFNDGIILFVKFKLKKGNTLEIDEKMKNYFAFRKLNQPYDIPSAGSIFKRKNDLCPAKIIDELGLKGLRIGDAMISKKHAGFIVNLGNATSSDVLKLIRLLEIIFKKYGYNFEKEIIYLK